MKILVVDDDDIALDMLAMLLKADGHEVEVAHDGAEALDIQRKGSIRLVISDWVMPRMDGLELCRRIRAGSIADYTYIILLTSRGESEDIVQGLTAGADEFLTKPFNPSELRVRLKTAERILSIETRHVTIFMLAKLVESRDADTGQHLDRIREYSRVLTRHIAGLGRLPEPVAPDYEEMIYLTSPLHDIGKVGIPDHVLLKPGHLSDEEYANMKTHTIIGGETMGAALKQYPQMEYLRMARDIALYHHERFNGTGYPEGLRGQEIPLCARIVALADVYDALTSKRVYKTAQPHEIARATILAETGRQFDPLVIDAFLVHEEEIIAIKDHYSQE